MTADPHQGLPAVPPRRTVVWAVLRGFLNATVLVVLYYVLPLGEPLGTGTVVRVLIGLAVFVAITAWQIRTITGSPYPGMKAVEAFGLLFPFYMLLFASTYFVMERASAASFTEPLTRTDALYFTTTVFSTVGSGTSRPDPSPRGYC